MKKYKVVILSRSFAKCSSASLDYLVEHGIDFELLRNDAPADTERIASCIGDADGVITGSDVIDRYVLERCPKLKVISKHGVGLDSIDLELAAQRGIIVTTTPTANNESVADLTLMMMLCLVRQFTKNRITSRSPNWESKGLANDLYGKTVGLIGYGRIGRAVARRLVGFGVDILVYDPSLSDAQIVTEGTRLAGLDALLKASDIISIHTPLTPETRNMINKETIFRMKDGAFLVNTSRGALVDMKDLYNALVCGKLGGAGLDVLPVEPPVNEPVLGLENVIATPHIASHTMEANSRMGMAAVQNIVEVLTGYKQKLV